MYIHSTNNLSNSIIPHFQFNVNIFQNTVSYIDSRRACPCLRHHRQRNLRRYLLDNDNTLTQKAPLCKGGWQKSLIFDWGIVMFRYATIPPSFALQKPPTFTQGRLEKGLTERASLFYVLSKLCIQSAFRKYIRKTILLSAQVIGYAQDTVVS